MDLKNLNTFIRVAQLRSFTKAADALGYSQSSVSAQIKQLEEELRAPLFDRGSHRLTLTAKGEQTLAFAYETEARVKELKDEHIPDGQLTGTVQINAGESFCIYILERGFSAFHARYPRLRLKFVESRLNDILTGLDCNEADFGVSLGERIFDTRYVIVHEERLPMSFVAGKGSVYDTGLCLPVAKVAEMPFILTEQGMGYRQVMDRALSALSLRVDPILELGNTDLICQMLAAGNGVSYLPDFAVERFLAEGKLVRLSVPDFTVEVWKQVLYHRGKWLSPQLKAAIDFFARPLSEYGESHRTCRG